MSDYKSRYSDASSNYVNNTIYTNELDMRRYNSSKEHEAKYNDNWSKQKVNLNDVVNEFAPNSDGTVKGMKYEFKGDHYDVVADMSAGYLRIWDKKIKKWVTLDREVVNDQSLTHYKIKRREEM